MDETGVVQINEKKGNSKKFKKTLSALLCTAALIAIYIVCKLFIPWFISTYIVLPVLIIIFIVAVALYLYSNKGDKYMFSWPALSFVTSILLAVFEKLAS